MAAQRRKASRGVDERAVPVHSPNLMTQHDPTWVRALAGRFVVFDGPDGSGKSTQFKRFSLFCQSHGVSVCEVREPGGTNIGEQIRNVLLDPANAEMSLRCEMMLYMASRGQLMEEKIRPALLRGELVLADRFISSTLAYQGTAGGLSREEFMAVGHVAIGEQWPDLTVVFDVNEQVAATRLNPLLDRMEQKGAAFHRRVREGYLEQVRRPPYGEYLVIDASVDADTIFAELHHRMAERFSPVRS
ncbi:MAG TPA: dTMP kinase [Phycisphaerales bacterium]|nr:dTMP kinase [Phycisphaerales bacterium]